MCRGCRKLQKEDRIGGGPYVSKDCAMLRRGSKRVPFLQNCTKLVGFYLELRFK